MPFWVSVILALFGMFYFNFFLEAVVLFLLSDLLHGASEPKFFGFVFISFIGSGIVLVLAEWIKNKLRFYPHKK